MALVSSGPAIPDLAAETVHEVYGRVTEERSRGGIARIAEAVGQTIELSCRDREVDCESPRSFQRLYRVELVEESRQAGSDGLVIEEIPRGTLTVAFSGTRAEEDSFDRELRDILAGLDGALFELPFAGLDRRQGLFESSRDEQTPSAPSFACFDGDTRSTVRWERKEPRKKSELRKGATFSRATARGGARVDEICDALGTVHGWGTPDELRARSSILAFEETRIRLRAADRLRNPSGAGDLTPLPEGTSATRQSWAEYETGSGSRQTASGRTHYRIRDGRHFETRLVPARLPASQVGASSWIGRFEIERTWHVSGSRPERRSIEEASIDIVLLPTAPMEELDQDGRPVAQPERNEYPVELDETTLAEGVATELKGHETIDASIISGVLERQGDAFGTTDWIYVICRSDGTASYSLTPVQGRAPLTNAEEFCGAVRGWIE